MRNMINLRASLLQEQDVNKSGVSNLKFVIKKLIWYYDTIINHISYNTHKCSELLILFFKRVMK